jgi:hypothetical protein
MSDSKGDEINQLSFACRNGVSVNKERGYNKKLAVAATYQHYQQLYGGRPSLSCIAHEHKVDRKFVRKIESELSRTLLAVHMKGTIARRVRRGLDLLQLLLEFLHLLLCFAIGYSWLDGLLRNPWSGVQKPLRC